MHELIIWFEYAGVKRKLRTVLDFDHTPAPDYKCNENIDYERDYTNDRLSITFYGEGYNFEVSLAEISTDDPKFDIFVWKDGEDMYCDEIHDYETDSTFTEI